MEGGLRSKHEAGAELAEVLSLVPSTRRQVVGTCNQPQLQSSQCSLWPIVTALNTHVHGIH